MAEISTKEAFNGYFATVSGSSIERLRSAIDRKELYEYEQEIGKELLDMDVDELFGLMKALINSYSGDSSYRVAIKSYDTYASVLRGVFNYYIDIAEVKIKNPFYDKRMKRANAMRELMKGQEILTWEKVEEIIKNIHKDNSPERADYFECLIRLFYEGVYDGKELVHIQEKDINFKTQSVVLPGRTVHLSSATFKLLVKVHSMEEVNGWRKYVTESWHGSYFKFIIFENKRLGFQDRPEQDVINGISRIFVYNINKPYNVKLNYSNLYWLGFYDYLVRKYGGDKTQEKLTSYRVFSDVRDISQAAIEYGTPEQDVTLIKKYLAIFVKY